MTTNNEKGIESCASMDTVILQNVEVQSNGILRNSKGR